jgi:C-terminal processing protease CtpA/Prc
MKRSIFIAFFISLILPVFISCEPDEIKDPVTRTHDSIIDNNKYVNNWIRENMEFYYYWTDKMTKDVDDTISPDVFFEDLLYRYDKVNAPDGDRFSWIEKDYLLLSGSLSGVTTNEIGFEFRLYRLSSNSDKVVGQIAYVKKNTPAEAAGVKRGMWFNRVNDVEMTLSNYSGLISFTGTNYNIGFLDETYNQDGTYTGLISGKSLNIKTLSSYSENPVYLDSIYNAGNIKVGYLVYNFFAPDNGSNDLRYDLKLNDIFLKFKTAGINELILDLRYNSGGYSSSAVNLASMIVRNLSTSKIYTYYKFNDNLQAYYTNKYGKDYFNSYFNDYISDDKNKLAKINNIGENLFRVIILTGNYTASASEQLINSLKPSMTVFLIGDVTYGKNVASYTIYEENDSKNKWGMQPIVARFFNSMGQSDFTAGFNPDIKLSDTGVAGLKQLGDINETLLNAAIDYTGYISLKSFSLPKPSIVDMNYNIKNPNVLHRGLVIREINID